MAAFSADSQRLASCSGDMTVKVWDAATGACLQTLEGHDGRVFSVAFSADGQRLASGSSDETVRVWDAVTGVCVQTLEAGGSITHLSFDPMTNSRLSTDFGVLHLDLPVLPPVIDNRSIDATLQSVCHSGWGISTDDDPLHYMNMHEYEYASTYYIHILYGYEYEYIHAYSYKTLFEYSYSHVCHYRTVYRRQKGTQSRSDCIPKSRRLSNSEEQIIVEHILDLDARGCPPRLRDVEEIANQLLADRQAQPVSKNWASNYLKRQPELKTRFQRRYDYQRARCEDPIVIHPDGPELPRYFARFWQNRR
ncbi:hypothetical protein FOYG_02302 [Fusarium oxysporum NRRL 32931]|uniref:HTH CENPB-type domain-containing protein n=1 Tax=Fusarium oxysporum NRRL 32931 TaxID=660029 RepID=W9IRB0_FUSOX|nr:hypothetical protein FOYG_02302 [Fusarium oxysporum NRRL 32931]